MIKIVRKKEKEYIEEFPYNNSKTLLDYLNYIKEYIDETLTFRSGCKSGICGSCAVRVNDIEKLACKCKIDDNTIISPLRYGEVIKDLVIELSHEKIKLIKSNSFLEEYSNKEINKVDEKIIYVQTNCILCQSCYSSCPVLEVNRDFLGPYVLTRVLRYTEDKKEANISNKLSKIQNNGIWECTLCGNCTIACPQGIDPKTDIMKLRMKSINNGYEDKNISNFNSYNNEFDFGFNPNGGF